MMLVMLMVVLGSDAYMVVSVQPQPVRRCEEHCRSSSSTSLSLQHVHGRH